MQSIQKEEKTQTMRSYWKLFALTLHEMMNVCGTIHRFKLGGSYVSRIEKRALKKLRDQLEQ